MFTALESPPPSPAPSVQEAAISAGRKYILVSLVLSVLGLAQVRGIAAQLAGNVQGAGLSIAGSMVTLYAAGTGAPALLAQGKTDYYGEFKLNVVQTPRQTKAPIMPSP